MAPAKPKRSRASEPSPPPSNRDFYDVLPEAERLGGNGILMDEHVGRCPADAEVICCYEALAR